MRESDTDGSFRKTVFLESSILLISKALALGTCDERITNHIYTVITFGRVTF